MQPSNAERQRKQLQQEKLQRLLAKHVQSYPVDLLFPARVFPNPSSSTSNGDDDDDPNNDSGVVATDGTPKVPYDSPENVRRLRTSKELIQYRLVESGLVFTDGDGDGGEPPSSSGESQTLEEVTDRLGSFVEELKSTGCYDSVQVILGRPPPSKSPESSPEEEETDNGNTNRPPPPRQIDVILQEKKWYKLYVGGGVKADTATSSTAATTSSSGPFPKIQFETSAGLLNLTGHCDTTDLSYTVDQTSTPALSLSHTRPFYALFAPRSPLREYILGLSRGSRIGATMRGEMDTVDYEHIRSCREYVQRVGMRVSNTTAGSSSGGGGGGGAVGTPYTGIDWTLVHRDIIPRRSAKAPYCCDASPEVLASSGPSLKHSVVAEYKWNGVFLDNRFSPTAGVDSYGGVEVAGPPGNVGFWKFWGGGAFHWPLGRVLVGGGAGGRGRGREGEKVGVLGYLLQGLSFHSAVHFGVMKQVTFGGILTDNGGMTNISDRFFVGGPHQLRGFVPGGIGPRAQVGGASTPGGDSIGGDAFYTATTALSIPFPGIRYLAQNGCRLFYFANTGTLAGLNSTLNVGSFMNSSRLSTGAGISVGTPIGRLEITYSVPLRYGPRDARKSIQAGMGFNFG